MSFDAAKQRSPTRVVSAGAVAVIICSLPVFLAGTLAVDIGRDIPFGAAALGGAVAASRAAGALTVTALGRNVDRFGATTSLRVAVLAASSSCIGIALLSRTWFEIAGWLVLAGLSKALVQPAANRMLSRGVPVSRQGVAFGFKQAAAPLASMLAGLSLPLLVPLVGWRGTVLLGAALAVLSIPLIGRRRNQAGFYRRRDAPATTRIADLPTVAFLAGAFGLAAAASSSIPIFYVPSVVETGTTLAQAGSILAVASLSAVVTRIALGPVADRLVGGHLYICAVFVALGALGLASLALEAAVGPTLGVVIALVGTWGTNGVFWYSVVRHHPSAPGRITGVVAPAGLVGGVVGPAAVGLLAEQQSWSAAWWLLATLAIGAASLMGIAARRVGRAR